MQTNRKYLGRILSAVLFIAGGVISSALAESNIESNFTRVNNIDLSGEYEVSGILSDSSPYTGSMKLAKWNTFTTPMGNVLQSFKMDVQYGDNKSNGVAVFDGSRLYYASGEGKNENYYLMILGKMELSQEAHSSLFAYTEGNRQAKKGEYVEWKGKDPWYGYLDINTQAYGYWFWIDGIWGQYATRGNDFPATSDSGMFFMLELKKDGNFGKMRGLYLPEGYYEAGTYNVSPEGENLRVDVSWYKSGGKTNSTWGSGFMTTHPVTGDSIMVAMIGGPDNTSYGWLAISGLKMVGVSTWAGSEGRCTEEWAVPDEVIKKNPTWFK